MCEDDTRPPYRTVSFSGYLSEIGIHPWVSDIAANSIRYGTPIDRSVADRMSKAFRGFVGGRICAWTVSEAVSRQGYTVSDVGRDCFSVMMNGDVWHICLDILPDKDLPAARSSSGTGSRPWTARSHTCRTMRQACSPASIPYAGTNSGKEGWSIIGPIHPYRAAEEHTGVCKGGQSPPVS